MSAYQILFYLANTHYYLAEPSAISDMKRSIRPIKCNPVQMPIFLVGTSYDNSPDPMFIILLRNPQIKKTTTKKTQSRNFIAKAKSINYQRE